MRVLACALLLTSCGLPEPPGTVTQTLYVDEPTVWSQDSIPVCWENGSSHTSDEQSWVRDAVEESWEHVADIDFTGWGACTEGADGIHIYIHDVRTHVEARGSDLDGMTNGVVLNFTYQNWNTGCQDTLSYCIRDEAVHEFGHALGFVHEQSRPDTPSSCNDDPAEDGTLMIGDWDEDSVMNYCNPDWQGSGHLSNGDVNGVQQIYGEKSDRKIYPATLCEQVGTEQTVSFKDTGRLYNGTTSSVSVLCPIIRDDTDGAPKSGAWVYIDDNHPTQNVTCTLVSHAATGTNQDSVSVTSSGSGATEKYALDSDTLTAYDGGHYYLLCTIPPMASGSASGLAAYSVREGT